MSLLFASSVSRYAQADAAQEWTVFQSNARIITGAGRAGQNVVRTVTAGDNSVFARGVTAVGGTCVLHFAWKPGGLSVWDGTAAQLLIKRAGVPMVSFKPTSAGGFNIYRGGVWGGAPGGGGTLIHSTPGGIVADGVWAQLQWKFVLHASAGTIEARLNGNPTPFVSLTAQNTLPSGDGTWDEFRFMEIAGSGYGINNDYCDFVVLDGVDATATQGKPFNTFLGDCSVRPHFPSGPGTSATWARSGADSGANWSQVEEPIANGDTDGVATTTTGNRDTYAMQDLLATGQAIAAVVPVAQVKKLDAGFASVGPAFRYGGVNYDPAAGVVPATAYAFQQMLNGLWVGLHPSGVSWTEANFNATEAGPFKVG